MALQPDEPWHPPWVGDYLAWLKDSRTLAGLRSTLAISKRDLLLFDSVLVLGLERQLEELHRFSPEQAASVEYLFEEEFFEVGPFTSWEMAGFGEMLKPLHAGFEPPEAELPSPLRDLAKMISSGQHPSVASIVTPLPSTALSLVSLLLSDAGCKASPVYDRAPTAEDWKALASSLSYPKSRLASSKSQLVEVVTDYLPEPSERVPLNDILDFSRDAKTMELKQRLLRSTARADLDKVSPEQFALNLEESLAAYKEHMKLIDAKQRGPVMKLLLSATGAIEELAHLRPRKAIEALLEFKTSRITGLEAELKAAGRETAFIYKAEKAFPPDR